MMKIETTELTELLTSLLAGEYSELQLTFNEFAFNYATAKQYFNTYPDQDRETDWLSPEEREKALENNTVWKLLWFPDSPVAHREVSASSLQAIVDWLCAERDAGNTDIIRKVRPT